MINSISQYRRIIEDNAVEISDVSVLSHYLMQDLEELKQSNTTNSVKSTLNNISTLMFMINEKCTKAEKSLFDLFEEINKL